MGCLFLLWFVCSFQLSVSFISCLFYLWFVCFLLWLVCFFYDLSVSFMSFLFLLWDACFFNELSVSFMICLLLFWVVYFIYELSVSFMISMFLSLFCIWDSSSMFIYISCKAFRENMIFLFKEISNHQSIRKMIND